MHSLQHIYLSVIHLMSKSGIICSAFKKHREKTCAVAVKSVIEVELENFSQRRESADHTGKTTSVATVHASRVRKNCLRKFEFQSWRFIKVQRRFGR